MNGFTAIADPNRRKILDLLRSSERDVNTLVAETRLSQPLVSKHLKVLRDAGLVESTVAGKRRVYRLPDQPMSEVLAWVAPFAEMWADRFDRLEAAMTDEHEER